MRRSALVVSALAAGALSACSAQVPRAADLVGTWRDGAGLARLVLAADGRCTAAGLDTALGSVTGVCRWRVGSGLPGTGAEDDGPAVQLDFSADPEAHLGRATFDVRDGGDALSFRDLSDDTTVTLHR